jgi:hypothetical protein
VRVRVPADLVQRVGRSHLLRSLGTADLRLAQQRRRAVLAQMWTSFETGEDGWKPAVKAEATVQNGPATTTPDDAPPPRSRLPAREGTVHARIRRERSTSPLGVWGCRSGSPC